MKIRTQISIYLGPFILIVISTIFFLNYHFVRSYLRENANIELQKTEQNMHRAAQELLSTAISNYLRAITEKNLEFIEEQYALYRLGKLTEREAKDKIQMHFNLQTVGKSGYLVAVKEMNSQLFLDLHPFLPGSNCTATEGCKTWAATRHGFTEYDWKNPADNSFRKKAAYVLEFPEWNWIVGASSYRDEFVDLVDVEELGRLIRPVRINKSGYFFLFDEKGTILLHPEFSNIDGTALVNSKGENILTLLLASRDGYLTYLWKNPSEETEQRKYAFVDKLEGYNWYLVATGYLSEIYEPIEYLKTLTMAMVLLMGIALFYIIIRLSNVISTPLHTLKDGVDLFYAYRDRFHWQHHNIDEINVLGYAFSRMSSELNRSLAGLEEKNLELRRSDQEKEKNRLFLDSMINSMPSIIIGVDQILCVTLWNAQAQLATGLHPEEAHGKLLFTVFPEMSEHQEQLQRSIGEKALLVLPYFRTDEFGKTEYSEITVSPLFSPQKAGAVIRIDRVTDRIEMEQRLRQSQKMDAVGQLAGGIAHDFNNMLSGIVGSAELLRLRVGPENQQLVKIITDASIRAGELIQKLLAFSRKEPITFVSVNVHNIISDTTDILHRTLDKRISIESRLEAESTTVMGDWSQLQNSLLNIGINAGHAMPDGGILTFSTANIELEEMYCSNMPFDITPGTYLQVTIRDTGCGIAKENLKRIFEPFFTTREINKGTGLGLAAVYGAVQQHKGAITVYSEIDHGTEFSLYLPLSNVKDTVEKIPEELVCGEGCILVVDDEPVVRITAKSMLERLGYSVLEAENGKEGLEVYKQHQQHISLVLLDMLMPVMDGSSCFFNLKAIDPDVKVVISSGFTRAADLVSLKEHGLCNFIRKPYSMTQVSQVIAQALNRPTALSKTLQAQYLPDTTTHTTRTTEQ
ncbi:cache domain-containing protein [Desulfopila aestuarii]|nr:cache domain-containing protein [Desulfopila aestuarii]